MARLAQRVLTLARMVQPTRDGDLGEDDATVSTLSFRQNDAVALAKFALAMLKEIAKVEVPNDRCAPLTMRIGLHVGRVVAGVVGTKKFRYDIWGKDVMTATLMESSGVPSEVCVSESMLKYLEGRYQFTPNPLNPTVELPHAMSADGTPTTIDSFQLVRETKP